MAPTSTSLSAYDERRLGDEDRARLREALGEDRYRRCRRIEETRNYTRGPSWILHLLRLDPSGHYFLDPKTGEIATEEVCIPAPFDLPQPS